MKKFIIGLALLLLTSGFTWKQPLNDATEQVVHAIIGEAAGETLAGQVAVACGILYRPEGLYGVNGSEMTRTPSWVERQTAIDALYWALEPGVCAGFGYPDMWCSDLDVCREAWQGVPMIYITKEGNHNFYRRITTKGE